MTSNSCSIGLMTGLGFGLMYLPAIDIIEVYFDREGECDLHTMHHDIISPNYTVHKIFI